MKKIDISNYDHFMFCDLARPFRDIESKMYKSGNYIEYLKCRCIEWFYQNCNVLFSMHNKTIPECYLFPTSGRTFDFQSFKKLKLIDNIATFNDSNINLYSRLTPDFERVVSILSEHRGRWRALAKEFKTFDLIEALKSKYKVNERIIGDNKIYELYFIYENQYLHEQFNRFLSAKDFYQWWDTEAIKILKPEEEIN
jgi:hypothetical protein